MRPQPTMAASDNTADSAPSSSTKGPRGSSRRAAARGRDPATSEAGLTAPDDARGGAPSRRQAAANPHADVVEMDRSTSQQRHSRSGRLHGGSWSGVVVPGRHHGGTGRGDGHLPPHDEDEVATARQGGDDERPRRRSRYAAGRRRWWRADQ